MAKITCGECGTVFEYKVAKDFESCPVCGASFDDEEGNVGDKSDSKENNAGEAVMYFDEIVIFENEPEYNHVSVYCGECKEFNDLELDQFDKIIDKQYVLLKDGITVTCRGCGKEHTARKILYKKKDHYAPPLPRCPVCNSAMLKKITRGSKIMAAATLGTFSLPYNSKTFECKDCGYRF